MPYEHYLTASDIKDILTWKKQGLDIYGYDTYICSFSGGKDSVAIFLRLLELGIPKHKIELWHNLVDGRGPTFMDWECTEDYCRKFAAAFGVPIFFSWKEGGFKREMLRQEEFTQPSSFEVPGGGVITRGGKTGKKSTRLKFPQVAADLTVRWCSGYLKRDVAEMALKNQDRFRGRKTLLLTGERAEESTARAGYKFFEVDHAASTDRIIHRCRLVHGFTEEDVWGIIRRWNVRVHPAYYLGYSRCSCKWCIFGGADQFATGAALSPAQGEKLAGYEERFGVTIKRDRDQSVRRLIAAGVPYKGIERFPDIAGQAVSEEYTLPIFFSEGEWFLPLGAYGNSGGPT